jgi:hypothetical protein
MQDLLLLFTGGYMRERCEVILCVFTHTHIYRITDDTNTEMNPKVIGIGAMAMAFLSVKVMVITLLMWSKEENSDFFFGNCSKYRNT